MSTTVQAILDRKGREVVTIAADASVLDAARRMNDREIGGLVVTDEDRIIGIFTERDILRRIVARACDPATTSVRDVMTTPVTCCSTDMELSDLRSMITARRIRHIPVVADGALAGIVTSGDLLAFQVGEHEATIEYLNSYVYGTR